MTPSGSPYNPAMPTGRPAKTKRSPLGERIAALRERAGLSQEQLADKVGSNQKTVAYWERRAVALVPERCTPRTSNMAGLWRAAVI